MFEYKKKGEQNGYSSERKTAENWEKFDRLCQRTFGYN